MIQPICRILLLLPGMTLTCAFAGVNCYAGEKKSPPFYLVGLDPGDPDLMTLRAVKVIEKADVIFCSKSWAEKLAEYSSRIYWVLSVRLRRHARFARMTSSGTDKRFAVAVIHSDTNRHKNTTDFCSWFT